MINTDSSQGVVYAPLCQTMSDSESEEELLHRNHNHARFQGKLPSVTSRAVNNITRIENHLMLSTEINYNNVTGNDFEGQNVPPTWTNTVPEKKSMSTPRRVMFFASIGLCVFVTVGFLWLLPCSDSATCTGGGKAPKTHNWLRDYEKIELKGMINTVAGLRGRGKNLIFMYRSDRVFAELDDGEHHTHGIISLIGRGGQVAWYDEMPEEPRAIDCGLVDVNKNGEPDCLVIGELGQMGQEIGALDPISGEWLWHTTLKSGNMTKIPDPDDCSDFPAILPDINGDGVKDLMHLVVGDTSQCNNVILISGINGQIIGKRYAVSDCGDVHKLGIYHDFLVHVSCYRNHSSFVFSLHLDTLYKAVTGKEIRLETLTHSKLIGQHIRMGQRRNTVNQLSIYRNGGKDLYVQNRGKCPHSCNMTIRLVDDKHDHELPIRSGKGAYGMVPTILNISSSKGMVSGFIIKLWEWTPSSEEPSFANIRMPRDFPEIVRNHTHSPLEPILRMRVLREVVLMILFNATDTRVINTSQNNIVQFCLEQHGEEIFCQPDVNNQENSLLIADIDNDGSQELISFYTTFISSDNEKENWRLITYVQLLRLESELAKLTDSESTN
ncbi:uncharacterized protein DMENIID0001_109580 [Sergentomyia squamirostris]